MHTRLQMLLREYGLTSSRLADILGIQPSAVSHIISGRNKPGFDLLSKILVNFPEVNPRWLILGEDPVYLDGASAASNSVKKENKGLNDSPQEKTVVNPVRSAPASGSLFPAASRNVADNPAPDLTPFIPENIKTAGDIISPIDLDIDLSTGTSTGETNSTAIDKVIILYTDGTFDSFNPK